MKPVHSHLSLKVGGGKAGRPRKRAEAPRKSARSPFDQVAASLPGGRAPCGVRSRSLRSGRIPNFGHSLSTSSRRLGSACFPGFPWLSIFFPRFPLVFELKFSSTGSRSAGVRRRSQLWRLRRRAMWQKGSPKWDPSGRACPEARSTAPSGPIGSREVRFRRRSIENRLKIDVLRYVLAHCF